MGHFHRLGGGDAVGGDQHVDGGGADQRHRAAREHAVGGVGAHRDRALVLESAGGIAEGAAAVDDVVDQEAGAAVHIADDVHHFRFAGAVAALVDDGQLDAEPRRQLARPHHAPDVGRDDDEFADVVGFADVLLKHRPGHKIVEGNVEETLNLPGMEVEGEDAVGPGGGDEVGHQLGRNRRARTGLAVLPSIAVVGDHRGDAPGRGAAQSVDDHKQFHHMVVGRGRGRLDDETVLAADVLENLDEHFLVGEALDVGHGQRRGETGGNRVGQRPVAVAGNHLHRNTFIRVSSLLGSVHRRGPPKTGRTISGRHRPVNIHR